jgi:hypothetical protein
MLEESMQQVTEIPPLAYKQYPVDVSFTIYPHQKRYELCVKAVGRSRRVPIGMTERDLAELNDALQMKIATIAKSYTDGKDHTEAERSDQLSRLAELGHDAFIRVFGADAAMPMIQELLAFGRPLSIEVVSEDFFLPWELIYPASLDERLHYKHFWGMNHTISRAITDEVHPGTFVTPVISAHPKPRLGLLTCTRLSAVTRQEIPFFEKLESDGKISLFRLRALNDSQRREDVRGELQEFKSFLANDLHITHFACHAFYPKASPRESWLELSNNFCITIREMDGLGIQVHDHPLIIMNACDTGNTNPSYSANFVGAFLRYGARGVLATECSVPDSFAADFAEYLYDRLLDRNDRKDLGASVLAARRYFLTKGNPSGLAYSMYAPPTISIDTGGS